MKTNYLNDIENIKRAFKEIIIDAIVTSDDKIISWPNYRPGISKKLYAQEYEYLKDNRQYSFILNNKGLVQFFYEFDEDVLKKAKLSYYPYPVKLRETEEEIDDYYSNTDDKTIGEYYFDLWSLFQAKFEKNISDQEIESIKSIFEKLGQSEFQVLEDKFNKKYVITNTSHIRFDYDNNVTSHNKFEIQYSSINSVRIPLSRIISPFLFMDFIVRNEFLDFYHQVKETSTYTNFFKLALNNSLSVREFSYNNFYGNHD